MNVVSKFDEAIAFQSKALGLRAYRQQVLAENIANADTPNYKARDFSFKSALDSSMAGRATGGLAMERTAPGHLSGSTGRALADLKFRQPMQSSADGNTVEMDVERAEFAENALRYEASLTFINSRIKGLMTAIQGQSA